MTTIDNILDAINSQGKMLNEHDALISDIFDCFDELNSLLKWHLLVMVVFVVWCICESIYTCWTKKNKNENDEKEYALLGDPPLK